MDRKGAIHWSRVRPVSHDADPTKHQRGSNTRMRTDENGRRVQERKPALSHQGDDYDRPTVHPQAERRYVDVVTHDGNEVALLLTNAASHLDTNTEYAGYQRAKARYFGWFPLDECPVRLIKSRYLRRDLVVDPSLLTANVCRGPVPASGCQHAIAERDARRARKRGEMAELDESFVAREQKDKRAVADAAATGIGEALTKALEPMIAELVKSAKRGR